MIKELQNNLDTVPSKEIVNILLAESNLHHFIRQAWNVVDKSAFKDNWHIGAIAEHLQAVAEGHIKRLLINVPPRHMKSLSLTVFFPCWMWLQKPSTRFLFLSYNQDLSTRDSLKCRRLLQSLWYQSRWSDKFQLVGDNNQKTKFENSEQGFRQAGSMSGGITGDGGDILVVDDAHNVKDVESDVQRNSTLMIWDEVLPTRINDPKNSAKILSGQRSHQNDLYGHVMEKEESDYVELILPGRFEKARRCITTFAGHTFKDPRTKEGEPLWKNHYGEKELKRLEVELGVYATAAQIQQRPNVRGGSLMKVEDFQYVFNNYISETNTERIIRYWDKAATNKKISKYTAGVKMRLMNDGKFIIENVKRFKALPAERENIIKQTAEEDGVETEIYMEQEPGSSGIDSIVGSVQGLAGFVARGDRPTGDKVTRIEPFAVQVEAHNVYLFKDDWNKAFLAEVSNFPMGTFKDQCDGCSGAFNKLTLGPTAGTWGSRR